MGRGGGKWMTKRSPWPCTRGCAVKGFCWRRCYAEGFIKFSGIVFYLLIRGNLHRVLQKINAAADHYRAADMVKLADGRPRVQLFCNFHDRCFTHSVDKDVSPCV